MNICIYCKKPTSNNKFCSKSCASKVNNTGIRRHGAGPNDCLHCGNKTKSSRFKYCSTRCCGDARRINRSDEEKKRIQRHIFMAYYTRKKNQTPLDADLSKIKEIYLSCPEGYEVDHIIPISKGGLHHQDNLQHLTISENRSKSNKMDWHSRLELNQEY